MRKPVPLNAQGCRLRQGRMSLELDGPTRRSTRVDSAAVVSSGVFSALVTIPISIAIARALGPEVKGIVALLTLILGYGVIASGAGVSTALIHFAGRQPALKREWASSGLGLGLASGLVAAAVGTALIFTVYKSRIPPDIFAVAVAFVLLAPVVQIGQFLESVLQGLGRIVEVSIADFIASVLTVAGAAIVLILHAKGAGWLVTVGLVHIVALLIRIVLCVRVSVLPARFAILGHRNRVVVGYGLRGYVGDLLHGINYRFDVFLVAAFLPLSAVGLYSVAVGLGEILLIVPSTLGTVLMQRAASASVVSSMGTTAMLTRLTSTYLIVAGALLAVGSRPIIRVFLGTGFLAASTSVVALLPGIWCLGIFQNLTSDLAGRGHYGTKSLAAAAGAILTVALDVFLIPRYGIVGASIASSCAYGGALAAAFWFYRRHVGGNLRSLVLLRRGDIAMLRAIVRSPRAAQTSGMESS